MDEISKGQTFNKGMLVLLLIVFLLIGLIGGYILNDVLRHDDNNDTDLVEDDNDSIAPAENNESNLESEKENDNFSNIEIPYLEGLKSLTLYVAEFTNDGMIYKSTKITNHSEMEEVLKQPIIIKNVSGAAGLVGLNEVLKATPDGYTIGYTSLGPFVFQPHMRNQPQQTGKR